MIRKSRVDDNQYQTSTSLVTRIAAEISDTGAIGGWAATTTRVVLIAPGRWPFLWRK